MRAQVSAASSREIETALSALQPERFGFHPHHRGWLRAFPEVGPVAFATLAWPHNQVGSFDDLTGETLQTNALGLLVSLQQRVWGFPPEEAVPVNVLSILEDTGGGIIVAYEPEKGFNAEGWLGFAIGMGTRSGVLYSHMLGVRDAVRGIADLGWCLKVLQGWLAVRSGHHAMTWTYDPLRGANARLNIEKLGATMINLTIDKYGVMRSSLYGDVPTDRFTAYWDLLDPAMHWRLHGVYNGAYRPLTLEEVSHIPEATPESARDLTRAQPPAIRYRIPGSIDELMRHDPERAVRWRQEMREVLSALMTVQRARTEPGTLDLGPIGIDREVIPGPYIVGGFATGPDLETSERVSYYVLRKGNPS
jgi:predicted GNAT superfamily acetyltransferase